MKTKEMEKLIKEDCFINSKVIAFYKSLKSEVDTNELIKYSYKLGKIVLLPKVVDNDLVFYEVNDNEKLYKSSFGILEPIIKENNVNNEIDLVIVPGVCFDEERNRLGFGKGFYDRFLSGKNLKTIGLCYEEQVLNNNLLPVDSNDIKIDKIISI